MKTQENLLPEVKVIGFIEIPENTKRVPQLSFPDNTEAEQDEDLYGKLLMYAYALKNDCLDHLPNAEEIEPLYKANIGKCIF